MPFAEVSGRITGCFEFLRCSRGRAVEIIRHATIGIAGAGIEKGMNFPSPLILSGREGDSRSGADGRVDIKIRQFDSLGGELVDVRRLDQRIAETTRIGEAHVVDEDDDDVGLGRTWLIGKAGPN